MDGARVVYPFLHGRWHCLLLWAAVSTAAVSKSGWMSECPVGPRGRRLPFLQAFTVAAPPSGASSGPTPDSPRLPFHAFKQVSPQGQPVLCVCPSPKSPCKCPPRDSRCCVCTLHPSLHASVPPETACTACVPSVHVSITSYTSVPESLTFCAAIAAVLGQLPCSMARHLGTKMRPELL